LTAATFLRNFVLVSTTTPSAHDSGTDADLAERVGSLERRVAALEAAAGSGTPTGSGPDRTEGPDDAAPGRSADAFWALQGLRERVDEDGGVLVTGTVTLPTGEVAEWQQGATTASLLDAEWDQVAEVTAALGHPARLRLLHAVLGGTRTAADLGTVEGLGTSGQVYHHLRTLVAAGWLRAAGRGRYEVPAARVVPLLSVLAVTQR
jgi:DNA-binding transcriptional ArsR family regulator